MGVGPLTSVVVSDVQASTWAFRAFLAVPQRGGEVVEREAARRAGTKGRVLLSDKIECDVTLP